MSEQTVYLRLENLPEYRLGSVTGSDPDEMAANVAGLLREAADEIDQQRTALQVVGE